MWSSLWWVLAGCVLNRTGQSATDQMQKMLSDHDRRVAELEAVSEDVSRRVGQIEEVTRARGQEEILKMETMEQLRQEVARLRGDVETLQHDYDTTSNAGIGFQQDADWRLTYTEQRIVGLERSLGVKAPPPPARDGSVAAPPTTSPTDAATAAPETAVVIEAKTPDEYFALLTQNLSEGKGAAARAVARRFIDENPKSDRLPEAYYRIAESYQNEAAYADAAAAFQLVVDRYGTSTWAPWAMLRQGECFDALGQKENAKLFWQETIHKYPKSKAATEAKGHIDQK